MCVRNKGLGWKIEMRKKIVLFLVLLLSLLSIMFIASVVMWLKSRYDPDLFGMHEALTYRSLYENLSISRAFEIMDSLGVRKIRESFWKGRLMLNSTEINSTVRDAVQQVIDKATSLDMEIMGYAQDFPSWMRIVGEDHQTVPRRNMTEGSTYRRFLEAYEESWETLAREFQEINVWEIGNEYNLHTYLHPPGYDENNSNTWFSLQESANITTDLLYYGSRGINASNPNAKTVMCGLGPGGNGIHGIEVFLDLIYKNIESGEWPSTNSDDFFQVACWHPYIFKEKPSRQNWVKPNIAVYDVMKNHGDRNKRVVFSEMGYTDNDLSRDKIANYLLEVFRLARNNFDWLDTIYWFRLTDRDDGFGVVEAPENWTWKPAAYAYESLTHPFPWWILSMVSGGCLLVTVAVLIFHRLRFRSKVLTDAPKTN